MSNKVPYNYNLEKKKLNFVKRLLMILKSANFDSPSVAASFATLQKIKSYTFSTSSDDSTENHKKMIRWKIEGVLDPS